MRSWSASTCRPPISRGLPRGTILRRHVLRNAAIPITTVVGLTIASLIALSAVVETAFGLNGLGSYLVQAAQNKDFAVVQGISLVLVVAVRGGQHHRRHRLRPARPAGRDREPSPVSIPVGSALPTGAVPEEPGPDAPPPGDAGSAKRRRLPRLGVGGWLSVAIIVFAVLLAVFGPLVRPFDPNAVSLSYANVGPYGRSPARASTVAGRDLLSRLMVGARTTLLGAALVVALVAVVDRLERWPC